MSYSVPCRVRFMNKQLLFVQKERQRYKRVENLQKEEQRRKEFMEQAVEMLTAKPETARYSVKYRHKDGKLVLKVTDDEVCIKFKTDQAQDLKRVEKLNNALFKVMTSKNVQSVAAEVKEFISA